ncbi:beta-ketoacyl-[acyl-carrier-protein] synthase family protein [Gimesia panareensis]|uniref:3-oxoacyl-[acyl-carrier-protein] synthase 2 n=1 Tax=Gimesia panareensis TaxID=2527978 RepID=A0A518FK01_9PLAN|nr:beta-ketoacyl-[acyl-carrier-protein] synthase family protein [Gimesia panareensis]QDU50094.1 3-oxoacyl-[acyl-carrier-protein] synthase 2 [Gimesia panareensis]QDV16620.1 3-oxoacyl-[acyl-carrier-protein] synthase 2 [Gimesia panareensis]
MRPPSTVSDPEPRRVVITGIGLITPYAVGREASWQGIRSGHSAIQPLEGLSEQLQRPLAGGIIPDARLSSATLSSQSPLQTEPSLTLALKATEEAIQDADLNLNRLNRETAGCVIGSSKGGMASFAQLAAIPYSNHSAAEQPPPELWPQCFAGAASHTIAAHYNLQAAALTPVSACATGFSSIMRGAELIREGICDTVLAGSTDASLLPAVLASFHRMGVLASQFDSPARACRPYDIRRNGFVVGEGAGILVLESLEQAEQRGVTPYAEWLTGGLGSDSTHLMQFDPEAQSLAHLINETLRRAGVEHDEIDYINLHGTGTQINDVYETHALQKAFGAHAASIACSSLKGGMGHLLGAAGSVELALTLLAMRDGIVPPTLNLEEPDPECALNYTPLVAVPREIRTALKLSFGFGGHLAAGLVRTWNVER